MNYSLIQTIIGTKGRVGKLIIFIEIVLVILAIFLFLMGYKFRKGQWLRLIAGNTFNDYPKEARNVAPFVGLLLYGISFFILIMVISLYIAIT